MENNPPTCQPNKEQPWQKDTEVRTTTDEKAKQGEHSVTDDDVRKITGFRCVLICVALYLSALMYGPDTTIAADVQGAVIETFSEVSQLSWIGAGFSLGSVALILPYGFLYTTFNMKWLYIAGIVLFQARSALCGASPTMNALIVGRVFAGAGGTGIYLGGLNHFSAMTTRQERGAYLSGMGLFGVWVQFWDPLLVVVSPYRPQHGDGSSILTSSSEPSPHRYTCSTSRLLI